MSEKTKGKEVSITPSSQAARPVSQYNPLEEMDRLFDTFMSKRWLSPFNWEFPERFKTPSFANLIPSVDVVERDNEVVVRAELPGIDKKDLDVSVTESSVTIKGSTKTEQKEEKGEYLRKEIQQGAFMRTINLPTPCDSGSAKAVFKDGLLEVTVDKTSKSKRFNVEVK